MSSNNNPQTITRDMTIQEIMSLFPSKAQKLAQIITNAGLHCVGCHAATYETLEAGMRGHGMDDDDIDALLDQLNALLSEQSSYDMNSITLTPRAAHKFMQYLREDNKEGWGLRFEDRLEGCSGFTYELDFSEKAQGDDEVFVSQGIEIHVNKQCVGRLRGSVIDYVEGLRSQGFKVDNPNAATSCGCGSSHNYGSQSQGGGCCGGGAHGHDDDHGHSHGHGHDHGHGGGCCGGESYEYDAYGHSHGHGHGGGCCSH